MSPHNSSRILIAHFNLQLVNVAFLLLFVAFQPLHINIAWVLLLYCSFMICIYGHFTRWVKSCAVLYALPDTCPLQIRTFPYLFGYLHSRVYRLFDFTLLIYKETDNPHPISCMHPQTGISVTYIMVCMSFLL
jgi:hypothetical protein